MTAARRFGAPILSRGCGTSLGGQCCNVAVVMDFSKYMHGVLHIDPNEKLGVVQPGCVLDDLRDAAKKHGLNFGPDPSTHSHCTLGGMLGNDSCGSHSLLGAKYGRGLRTADNTHELEILTYDGLRLRVGETPPDELERIIRRRRPRGELYGKLKAFRDKYADEIRRRLSEAAAARLRLQHRRSCCRRTTFHVARALVGSEGTLVTILEATMNLVPNPGRAVAARPGLSRRLQGRATTLMEILAFKPTALEGMRPPAVQVRQGKGRRDGRPRTAAAGRRLPHGRVRRRQQGGFRRPGTALHGDAEEAWQRRRTMKLLDDPRQEEMIWKVREGGLGSTAWVPGRPDAWPGWEDSAVPPDKVGAYLRDLRKLFDKYGYNPSPLRPFRPGLHPLPRRLRPVHGRGHRDTSSVHGRGGRPGRALRRLAVRRARRRPGPRRVPAQDVRRRARPGVPRVQVDLGPAMEDEPRQDDRRLRRSPRTCASAPTTTRRSPRRTSSSPTTSDSLRPGRAALRRRRRVPQRGRPGHVPQLPW